MHIIIVNDFGHITGGADKVALTSAVGLAKAGHDVTVFTAVEPIMKELLENNIKVICTEQFDILHDSNRIRALIQGIWNKKAYEQMIELLDKKDASNTIVHIHSWTKALSSSVSRAATEKKFKVVLTLHDYFSVCPNGGFYNYEKNEICKLKPLSKECIFCNCDSRHYYHKLWRVLRQKKQFNKGLIPKGINNYIYISELNKQVLQSYLPKTSNLYYVKNPIDIEKEEPVDVSKNSAFVFIGRLTKEKGVTLFAKAASELNCEAIFVGDGQCRNDILKINSKAKITGWVEKKKVNSYLKSARALIFPSLWYEGMPLAVLEAIAKGIPVIVSDTCASREVVKNSKTGLWFRRGDASDLISKIKLLYDDDYVRLLGNKAYLEYWNNDYSSENHIKQLESVYLKILNNQ